MRFKQHGEMSWCNRFRIVQKTQGFTWYKANGFGFVTEDHLATTFDAFMDVNWIRSFPPVMGYNKVAIFKGRKVDYDTYLEPVQYLLIRFERKARATI